MPRALRGRGRIASHSPAEWTCVACGHNSKQKQKFCVSCLGEIDALQDMTWAMLKEARRKAKMRVKLLDAALTMDMGKK